MIEKEIRRQYMTGKLYARYADARAAKSPLLKDCLIAWAVGGTICSFGEALRQLWLSVTGDPDSAGLLVSLCLILLTTVLTGIGVFDKLARHAGGGTLVPITGFANSVVSAAMDSRSEGFVTGVGVKIFTVAGPVILYGTAAGVLWGFVFWLTGVL